MTHFVPPWWRMDPAPDFLKFLKEDELRVFAGRQLDIQLAAIKRQKLIVQGELEDLDANEKLLIQIKAMVGKVK